MTVKELKEELNNYDDNAEVLITSEDEDLYNIDSVETTMMAHYDSPTLWINR